MNPAQLFTASMFASATESADAVETAFSWITPNLNLGEIVFILTVRLLLGSLFLYIGLKLVKVIARAIQRATKIEALDPSIASFTMSLIRIVLYVLLFYATFSIWGFATTSFLAIVGGMSLAVGLALQGSMSNVASGVLILLNKPIQVGDFITVQTFEGTVKRIELFHTTITTFDNKSILIPNSLLMTQPVINFSRERLRRFDIRLDIAFNQKLQKAIDTAQEVLDGQPNVLTQPNPPEVIVVSSTGDIVTLAVRGWVEGGNLLQTKRQLLTSLLQTFHDRHIVLASPIRAIGK